MDLLSVTNQCFEDCINVAKSHEKGAQIIPILTMAKGAMSGYSEPQLAQTIFTGTIKHWERLALLEDDSSIGSVTYDFTNMFGLKSYVPHYDRVLKAVLTGELEAVHRKALHITLKRMVKMVILHVHTTRTPVIENGEKTYKKNYTEKLKVLYWAKKFLFVDELQFTDNDKKRKREAGDEDTKRKPDRLNKK